MMPVLEAAGLSKHFQARRGIFGGSRGVVRAVDHISFAIESGKTLGVVGESGCGKTTTAKLVLGLEEPTGGSIRFEGRDLHDLDTAGRRHYRKSVQAVFQDPYASLSPRMRISDIIAEPLVTNEDVSSADVRKRVLRLLDLVGLAERSADLFPHEFSGGQRQRIAIARAIVRNPSVLLLDEATSALDQTTEAAINKTLMKLAKGRTMIFSTHRLTSVVDMDEIIVISGGRAIERGSHAQLLAKNGVYRKLWDDQGHQPAPAAADGNDDEDDDDDED
jgi:ATP-binding cassette subfamily B protein